MRGIAALLTVAVASTAFVAPASAETWKRFSASDRTVYLVDEDSLVPVEGVVTTRFARVPTRGEAADQTHDIEEVQFRCADSQSKTVVEISYGADGAEAERFADEAEWEAAPTSGLIAQLKSLACDNMRAQGESFASIAAFIAAGRKAD
ncbi:hypothetical protein LTR94_026485 [Friedmanniomyces endolithicus]|nr:hypothetical protein LTR94_026485 [Friedmanniomyces endolithicus]